MLTFVSSIELISELTRAPATVVSLSHAYRELLQLDYIAPGVLGTASADRLVRVTGKIQHDIIDHDELEKEVSNAFASELPAGNGTNCP